MKRFLAAASVLFVGAVMVSVASWGETDSQQDSTPEATEPTQSKRSQTDGVGVFADVFHVGTETADDLAHRNLAALSLEERTALGAKIHKQVLRQAKQNTKLAARLARLAEPLLAKRKSSEKLSFTFTVLESKELNAFSHVGGYVYVNTSLLKALPEDESLQFVLGHEIAHVELGHCARNAAYCQRAEELGGGIAGAVMSLSYRALSLGYSEKHEHACDAWAYVHLRNAGVPHEKLVAFFKTLLRAFPKETKAPMKPPVGSVFGRLKYHLDGHFRSHPAAVERIRRLELLRDRMAAAHAKRRS